MATKDARAKTESNEVWALGLCADRNRLWVGRGSRIALRFTKGIPRERRKMSEHGQKTRRAVAHDTARLSAICDVTIRVTSALPIASLKRVDRSGASPYQSNDGDDLLI